MGVLSCLTAAWWGSVRCLYHSTFAPLTVPLHRQFSDRYGRTRVIALCGIPFIDAAYLLVGIYRNAMPLKYRFVIVGYAAQGLVGGECECFMVVVLADTAPGISSLMSIMQAYITDCTDDSARYVSRISITHIRADTPSQRARILAIPGVRRPVALPCIS